MLRSPQSHVDQNLDNHSRIGMDPTLITAADAESLQTSLRPKESHLVSLTENLIDHVWENRPARTANEIIPLDIKYSGMQLLVNNRLGIPTHSTHHRRSTHLQAHPRTRRPQEEEHESNRRRHA